jgi:NADH-ubiquinone oxidoreductase chain 5
MLIPVLIISSLVHIYSIGYMSNDPHQQRFFSYLSLFTFMMILLVTGNNYLLMFVGWEGVGVCSYLLVCFWFSRIAANQSSISAFLTNRVGDCFLTIGMFAILWTLGNLDYATVFSLAPYINENLITIIGICLVIGAMAKSSQVGLHVWLPMAMEGPTPVSALIHAATMVTAGVYLLMRSSPLIEYSSTVLLICLWLGAITTVFSSLVGLFQQDIKKVIAYSTMSQLGMMVIAIGLSSYNLALFHLVNHAFYKALLFLGAGAVIHAVADNQDFRRYGGLISFLPLTYSVILIASLSLVAFPFMTGFYSKDFILESAFGQYQFSSIAVYVIATIGAVFTTLYSVKVLYLTFLTNPNGPITSYKHAHESDIFISLPLIILAVFSIFFGYITKDIFIGLGSGFFVDNSIFIHPVHEIMLDTEFAVPTLFKLLPFIFTVSFSILAIVLSEFLPGSVINFKLSTLGHNIFGFFNQRFLVEMFYNNYVTNLVLYFGGQTSKVLDKGSIELIGPFGLEKALINFSKNLTKLSTGVVTSYALYILVGLISFIFILYLSEISASLILLLIILASYNLNDNKQNYFVGGSLPSVTSSSHLLNLGIVPLRGKVVNSSFTNFSRFNGLSNNGIMLKSQVKYKTGFIFDEELQCKVGRTYTINGLNFTIVKPFSTSNNRLALENVDENGNEENSEGNNSTDNSNNSPSSSQEVSDNHHAHTSNSPRSSGGDGYESDENLGSNQDEYENQNEDENENSSSEGGYESDQNRSWFEEGADTMADYPARDLPDDHLRRYIQDTRNIKRHPEMAGIDGDSSGDEGLRQHWADRHEELRAELRRRKEEGVIPDSSSESENSSSTSESTDSKQDNVSNRPDSGTVPTDSGTNESGIDSTDANDTKVSSSAQSTNKRRFEEDDESSTQPSKRFKQDSSDVTGDIEPYDFIGGEES